MAALIFKNLTFGNVEFSGLKENTFCIIKKNQRHLINEYTQPS